MVLVEVVSVVNQQGFEVYSQIIKCHTFGVVRLLYALGDFYNIMEIVLNGKQNDSSISMVSSCRGEDILKISIFSTLIYSASHFPSFFSLISESRIVCP